MMGAHYIPSMVASGRKAGLSDKEISQDLKELCEGAAEQVIELIIDEYEKTAKDVEKVLEKLK